MEMIEKKEIVHEVDQYPHGTHHKEYASKGVAGAGLGLGIAGTALALLNNGGCGLFGWGGNRGCGDFGGPSTFAAWSKASDSAYAAEKALYDYALLDSSARFNDRQTLNQELFGVYKSQVDADFNLYKYSRDAKDELSDRISKVETALAVNSAIDPWRSKVLQMQIGEVAGLVNLEAERRCCADNAMVTYNNATFYPKSIADVTVGTTTTSMSVYNPLPNCNGCKCNSNITF